MHRTGSDDDVARYFDIPLVQDVGIRHDSSIGYRAKWISRWCPLAVRRWATFDGKALQLATPFVGCYLLPSFWPRSSLRSGKAHRKSPSPFLTQLGQLCACRWYRLSQELYYTNRLPIDIWVPPIPTHRPNRNAIITFIFEPGLALSAAVLGHSISRYRNAANLEEGGELAEQCANVDMVLMHLEGVLGAEERRELEDVGWTLRAAERVYSPADTEEPHRRVMSSRTSPSRLTVLAVIRNFAHST
jgi:hypothetical protein